MSRVSDIQIEIVVDNSQLILDQVDQKVDEILERIGEKCRGYAVGLCPVDTGLLRNSITYALSGRSPAMTMYHASNGGRKSTGDRYTATDENAGSVGVGFYSGSIGSRDEDAVYVGTNVEYAPYVELGVQSRPRYPRQPFLQPACENHKDEYKRIADDVLQTIHT